MLSANDLLLIGVLARDGTAASAAAALKVHVATLYRRLTELERETGTPLFRKIGGRYSPTPLGAELARSAAAVEASLADAQRRLSGGEQRLEGRITVTTADSLVPLVAELLHPFRREHAGIHFDLVVSNSFADMARYEAEVAIRPTRTPPETLVGQKAGTFGYGIFAADRDASALPWIVLDDSLASVPAGRWLAKHTVGSEVALRVNSMWVAGQAAASGLGKALLPDYLAKQFGLLPLGEPIDGLESEVWLLIHADLRRTPRIRSFMDFAGPLLRSRLTREAPTSSKP
ncbi:LysR family transcriptional regulator [Aquamicrobium terrae]|uniref:DNA-binding transcriptional LysR family regulator n=1 Tax=Aquamicrobium terrae TaxID=1324945 RepID=A0ABV2N5Y9_9HYPH